MIDILLIGNGKWGQKYVSILQTFPHISLTIANRDNWKELIDKKTNGVIVCTPPSSHIEIACYALSHNIPTMIEKPIALSLEEAQQLKQFTTPILVNNIHLFSQCYKNLKNIVDPDKITNISTSGYNNGPVRTYSSLWDYGSHDISMILDLTRKMPNAAHVVEMLKIEHRSLFDIQMHFDNFTTHSIVGNGGNSKYRTMSVEFDGITISYDDDKRPSNHIPPLTNAILVFLNVVQGMMNYTYEPDYRMGIELSLNVLKILECCDKSLQAHNIQYL